MRGAYISMVGVDKRGRDELRGAGDIAGRDGVSDAGRSGAPPMEEVPDDETPVKFTRRLIELLRVRPEILIPQPVVQRDVALHAPVIGHAYQSYTFSRR